MFIEIQNLGRNPLVGTWASLPTVQTGKQVHLIRVCVWLQGYRRLEV